LHGCETWSFTLREKHRLKILVGPMMEEAAADWRKLHSEELQSFYSSPNIIQIISSKRMV
jgi:hypothetical protein